MGQASRQPFADRNRRLGGTKAARGHQSGRRAGIRRFVQGFSRACRLGGLGRHRRGHLDDHLLGRVIETAEPVDDDRGLAVIAGELAPMPVARTFRVGPAVELRHAAAELGGRRAAIRRTPTRDVARADILTGLSEID